VVQMAGGAILAGEAAWLCSAAWERWIGHGGIMEKLGAVFVPLALASLLYGAVLLWLNVPQAREFFGLLRRKLRI
ncbi:MAG: murein biosynthesis integral membrane protein MurJ, partial [Verrucomicrobia bacterium]|nr:murein biosynthesis integral membrane protein MurJ [Verrucomicrobiota bacterium]